MTDNNEICSVPTNELQLSYKNTVTTKSVDNKTVVSYDESAYANLNKFPLEELHYNNARYLMISLHRVLQLCRQHFKVSGVSQPLKYGVRVTVLISIWK